MSVINSNLGKRMALLHSFSWKISYKGLWRFNIKSNPNSTLTAHFVEDRMNRDNPQHSENHCCHTCGPAWHRTIRQCPIVKKNAKWYPFASNIGCLFSYGKNKWRKRPTTHIILWRYFILFQIFILKYLKNDWVRFWNSKYQIKIW